MKRWPLIVVVLWMAGCAQDPIEDDDGQCLDQTLAADCAPQYEPTFANVYQQTIVARCAIGGRSCHLAEGAKGGLILEGVDRAYDALVTDGRVTDDPACSLLIRRLEAVNTGRLMPPGTQLTEPERCAVTQWVRQGAQR